MKPTPPGWPRMSAALFYDDPRRAIQWLCDAFGFEVRMVVDGPGGEVAHSELEFGEALLMVAGGAQPGATPTDAWRAALASPGTVGGRVTANLALYVDDVDTHCARAREHGARIVSEPADVDYGPEHWSDRNYCALDCEGHVWWFMQRLETRGG